MSIYNFTKYTIIVVLTSFNDKRTELANKLFFVDQKEKPSSDVSLVLVLSFVMTTNIIRNLLVRQIVTLLLNFV